MTRSLAILPLALIAARGVDAGDLDLATWASTHLAPLTAPHPRWPLVLWTAGPRSPLPRETYEALLARGIAQHVRLDPADIPLAQAVQAAGSPVIVMEGRGGTWPAELGGNRSAWGHRFDAGYAAHAALHPCPLWLDGWAAASRLVRETLTRFRDAGVTVNAVWMDWEGDPLANEDSWDQARHCERCRRTIPAAALRDADAFRRWRVRLWTDLLGAYLAAPVREVFPTAEVSNWMLTASTPERPLRFWEGTVSVPSLPPMVTATTPVAYGDTQALRAWDPAWPRDQAHADRFYTHVLLRMVSEDARNRAAWAPHLRAFPWVARFVPDDPDPRAPALSRERYREVLRHLWLRGVDGMQVFDPVRPGQEDMARAEVEDAQAVYAEVAGEGELLQGTPMNLDVPGPQSKDPLWSGRRLGDRAVVRVFLPEAGRARVRIPAWPDRAVTLTADGSGRTWHLTRTAGGVEVR